MIRTKHLPPHLSPAQRNQKKINVGDRLVDKTGKMVTFIGVRKIGYHRVVETRPIWSN